MNQVVGFNYLIPAGNDLRVLLNSAHISYGEVHSALKAKGVFCGNPEKGCTVPILSALLLRPTEYTQLLESSVNRESKPKFKLNSVDLVDDKADWISPLKNLFDDEFDPFLGLENVEVADFPSIVVENNSLVKIPYKIHREDFSQDWVKRELDFSGEISIEREGGNLRLDFSSTHTSKETEAINRRLIAKIFDNLKGAELTKEKTERRITFASFDNVERVRFFKRLTGGHDSVIKNGSVHDMEINRDPSGPRLPDDPQVSWMNQTVKRLKIDGEKLNEIFLISDEKYYSYYHIQRMNMTFPYSFDANSGEFRASFFFSTPSRSDDVASDSELTFEISRISHDHTVNSDSKREIEKSVSREVRKMIETEFDKILRQRP